MVRTDRPLEEKMTLFWHGPILQRSSRSAQCAATGRTEQNCSIEKRSATIKRLTGRHHPRPGDDPLPEQRRETSRAGPMKTLLANSWSCSRWARGNGYNREGHSRSRPRALTGVTVDRFGETSQFISGAARRRAQNHFSGRLATFTPRRCAGTDLRSLGAGDVSRHATLAVSMELPNRPSRTSLPWPRRYGRGDWELAPAFAGTVHKLVILQRPLQICRDQEPGGSWRR